MIRGWTELDRRMPSAAGQTCTHITTLITQHISCMLPLPENDPILNGLVRRFQLHTCNSYCLRKKKGNKAKCKFSFPRETQCNAVLHSVTESIVSRKSGSFKRRLYDIVRTKSEDRINDYNPILLSLWKGNMDIQFIGEESHALVHYIAKYATKGPKSSIDEMNISNF